MAKANAKINLSLDIVGTSGGYHMLKTVMHEIPLHDTLEFNFGGTEQQVETNLSFISNEGNIALAAVRCFYQHSKIASEGVKIYIDKRIPVGAGLGGGSADAACVLRMLNEHYDRPLSDLELLKTSEKLGADVPFLLHGGAALCEGKGEILTPLPVLPPCSIVVVKPQQSISTVEAFRQYDLRALKVRARPDTDGLISALKAGELAGVARRLFNVMEQPSSQLCNEITELHVRLLQSGADGAAMTGSGSAVFGIFREANVARKAHATFDREHDDGRVFVVDCN